MKRILSVVILVFLLTISAIPAFAADTPYTPEIPPFLTVGGGKPIISDYDKLVAAHADFFENFKDGSYLVLLEQWKGYASESKDWYLTFVKVNTKSSSSSIGSFEFSGGTNGVTSTGPYYIAPVRYVPDASLDYDILSIRYLVEEKEWQNGFFEDKNSNTPITFTYVVDSSPLSGTAKDYPYRNKLAGTHPFAVTYDKPRHYDWWLNINGTIIPPVPDPDLNVDTDGDGKPDLNVDTNGDGKPDVNIDTNGDKRPDVNVDTNGDGKPDINIDTNGDGKPDLNIDTNGDKRPDVNVDTDGDGKPNINIDSNGDGKPDVNVDTNGDSKPDINIDTNNDSKPDVNIDTNGDKRPDVNVDTDGDGKPNINIDSNGDGKPDVNVDTNGDNKPDINIDTDNDGKPDVNIDTNGDGKPDTNLKPDGGGSGGGSSGSGSGGSGGNWGDDWFDLDDGKVAIYNDFPIFDPFSYDNFIPPAYNDSFTDYNPLDGYESYDYMPEIPRPKVEPWNGYDPFKNPYK